MTADTKSTILMYHCPYYPLLMTTHCRIYYHYYYYYNIRYDKKDSLYKAPASTARHQSALETFAAS